MKKLRPTSLQWQLVRRLILLQAATLFTFVGLIWLVLFLLEPRLLSDNETAVEAVSGAVARDASGNLSLRDTKEMHEARKNYPNLWLVVRDEAGKTLRLGEVPDAYAGEDLRIPWGVEYAFLRFPVYDVRPDSILANRQTAAGAVQILTSTILSRTETNGVDVTFQVSLDGTRNADGQIEWMKIGPTVALIIVAFLAPFFIVMGGTTLVATPTVVRRSLAGLVATATQAGRIDIDNRGVQLPTANVPGEVAPLVQAFNNALSRLGQGYDQRNRFLTDAAHELRTPIAILRTRAELLREDPESARLLKDIERLSHLAQQLLDRQVLDQSAGAREIVDLVEFARHLAADFAPLALSAGYDFSFEPAASIVLVNIQPSQIQQAVTNLLRNAIDHGGGEGIISVVVDAKGGLEIHDEGPGIPDDEHERVFQPFYRLRPRNSGAGLGLNLAREIARLHGGSIEILVGQWRGARIRLQLPLLQGQAGFLGAKSDLARQGS
ncbi:sensor histidine kinase [Aminobacter carboxidus]|uniref:histidine kinase n=1 Tax=Aminobacter carboxidus TaxID=376165 RepID=A0ABR9GGB2_9HYPH|nr:HAMP domain-containing sensor histidine kinase [Aminobacter carboxidus]MBE1202695.1 HAMP domain-containing histidine kinase [Aminobacter carboxidus]